MAKVITEAEFNKVVGENDELHESLEDAKQKLKAVNSEKEEAVEAAKDRINELEHSLNQSQEAVQQLTQAVQANTDASWFAREIEGEKAKTVKAEAELKRVLSKHAKEKAERELNEADAIAAEEKRLAEIKESVNVSQNEHTRFRVLERSPSGQRDIFGIPDVPVVDLGVEFHGYFGGVFVPVNVFIEVGQSIGMLTAEQSTELIQKLETSNARANSAPEFAKELQNGIDRLIGEFNTQLSNVVADVPVGDENSDENE